MPESTDVTLGNVKLGEVYSQPFARQRVSSRAPNSPRMFESYVVWSANSFMSPLDICPGCKFPTDSLLTQETDSENCLDCLYKKKKLKYTLSSVERPLQHSNGHNAKEGFPEECGHALHCCSESRYVERKNFLSFYPLSPKTFLETLDTGSYTLGHVIFQ